MMPQELDRVRDNIRKAETQDLLDRVAAYGAGLDSDVVPLVHAELRRRGVTLEQILDLEEAYRERCLFYPDGTAMQCSKCRRPAVGWGLGWLKIFGLIPVIPHRARYCALHHPQPKGADVDE